MNASMPKRPLVIAHRGASGYLPEHTLVAKALAAGMGADYLEQDVVATRDGALLVHHDLTLDALTDVAERFPARARPDGHWYCIDFTLDEIRTLTVGERRARDGSGPRYPGRFPDGAGRFRIPTLSEELAFIRGLSRSMGRALGIYAEIKDPTWHRQQGIDLTVSVLAEIAASGFATPGAPAFLQCFDAQELRRLRLELGCTVPLVQLLDEAHGIPDGKQLAHISGYAQAIGPPLRLLPPAVRNSEAQGSRFVGEAHAAGLAVHPYTLRREDLAGGSAAFDRVLERLFLDWKVDGLFTDFPDLVARFVARHFAA